jgi:hypothetical protein
MRIFNHIIPACICVLLFSTGLHAQEMTTPLFGRSLPAGDDRETSGIGQPRGIKHSAGTASLELPFMDDFSGYTGAPDSSRWTDDHVSINRNYGIDPVSLGVATLDAIDGDGSIYPDAEIDPRTFVADYLTSQPLQLNYPVSDSIYLSFLYQPKGRGDRPETGDSLAVDFYDPVLEEWTHVWGIPGDTLHEFRHAMVPVTDERFLKEGFRFRFRNRASLPKNDDYPDKRANVDHWNVDYVRLDRNRYITDTVLTDVAITAPLSSILKDLTALPWDHFDEAFNTVLGSEITMHYRNNDTISRNVTRTLEVRDMLFLETYTPGVPTAQDIPPMEDTTVDFTSYYPFDLERGDSGIFRYRASLRTDEFDHKTNDTVTHYQLFKDYYAYDDGTPEAGYGLRGQGTRNGSVAVKYNAFASDLLGGVEICFNQLYDSVNLDYYFRLMVWDEREGKPGPVLWEDEQDHTPEYTGQLHGFKRYYFSQPVPVNGIFYVGWTQYNEYMLNVGLDLNNRPSGVMFYNFNGTWQSSLAPGVIMFRPFLYRKFVGTDVTPDPVRSLLIYPNPASDRIHLEIPDDGSGAGIRLEIFDVSGRLVDQGETHSKSWNVSRLQEGMYVLRATSGGISYTARLLINP